MFLSNLKSWGSEQGSAIFIIFITQMCSCYLYETFRGVCICKIFIFLSNLKSWVLRREQRHFSESFMYIAIIYYHWLHSAKRVATMYMRLSEGSVYVKSLFSCQISKVWFWAGNSDIIIFIPQTCSCYVHETFRGVVWVCVYVKSLFFMSNLKSWVQAGNVFSESFMYIAKTCFGSHIS